MQLLSCANIFAIAMLFMWIITAALILYLVKLLFHRTLQKNKGSVEKAAQAVLLHIEATGAMKNELPEMLLQLHVKPAGSKSFVLEIKEGLDHNDIQQYLPGKIVDIKYNTTNIKKAFLIKNCVE